MIRCKPLLGTYVEISTSDEVDSSDSIESAFKVIERVQSLMGFHNNRSELSKINACAHIKPISIDPWMAQVITIAQDIHQQSNGVFNCGIGHHLVEANLLPRYLDRDHHEFGGIEHISFLEPSLIRSAMPLCIDLGGIAKGFAVDMAVNVLRKAGIEQGLVNAGGDIRVFGSEAQTIFIRNPKNPHQLINVGALQDSAIATSGLYFANGANQSMSNLVDPISQDFIYFSESYSVIAVKCVYADALTKVVSISGNVHHPCLSYFSAQAIKIPAL